MYLQHDIATDKELASCCARSNLDRDVLYELHGGHSVIRVSSDAVIKCGFGVTQEEATSQIRAYNLIDQTIIRVPRVHRFFTYKNIGHIVMEFIDGEPLNSTEDLAACGGIAKALAHFSQIRNDLPGPLSGGLAYGLLWIEGDWISPTSAEDVENYFNTRQLQHHEKLNIKDQAFSLCHLDIAPRNVLRLRNGSLCLLDWASAGFYPRFFEVCALRLNNIHVDQVLSLEALN
jgi:serine/threonine protein kinase